MINSDPAIALGLGMTSLLAALLFYVWTAIALAAVFRKSGEEGWKAWVPVLNLVVLLHLAGLSGWLVLLFLIPVVGWVCLIFAAYRVNQAFGHGAGMTALAALLFPVWATVLGFGSARWVGRERAAGKAYVRSTPTAAPPRPPLPAPGAAAAAFAPIAFAPGHEGPAAGSPPSTAGGWTPPLAEPERTAEAVHREAQPTPPPSLGTADVGVAGASPFEPTPTPTPSAPAAGSPGAGAWASDWDDSSPPAPISSFPRRSATPVEPPEWAADSTDGTDGTDGHEPAWGFERNALSATGEVTGPASGAPAPVSAAPRAAAPPLGEPPPRGAVGQPPVTSVPGSQSPASTRQPWAPARSPVPGEGEVFPDTTGAVSAVVGAPDAGTPRSAWSSASAGQTRSQVPEDDIDETVIAARRRTAWTLIAARTGQSIRLTSDVVIVGRRPSPDAEFPHAQLVALDDDTRTVSKTHARLELRDDRWYITDLDSTNGVLFTTPGGSERAATPGQATDAGDTFLLGDAEVSLRRGDG